jgi:tRNA threonylcarbamoyladenosine biosynthesis protein TsaB
VAATAAGEVLCEVLLGPSEKGGPLHATALLVEVERAVEAAGGWSRIETIAVGTGPGSFTGLRVGLSTAGALAMSRGIPLAGVPTVDALGRAMSERAGASPRLALIDARRGEAFAALYDADGGRRWGPEVSSPEALAKRVAGLAPAPLGAGSGAVRFRQQLSNSGIEIPDDSDPLHRVAARHICEIAAERGADVGRVGPIYLRSPDAERWHERDTLQKAR